MFYACLCVTTFIFSPILSSCCTCLSRVHYAWVCMTSIADCFFFYFCRSTCAFKHTCRTTCAFFLMWNIQFIFCWIWIFKHIFVTGSTLISRKYLEISDRDTDCTGEYTMETYTIGACSTGGVKVLIVPGTASLVPSLAPTAFMSALTLELSGYSVTAQYSDDRCTVITSAVSYPLNSCNEYQSKNGVSEYAKYTATAYTIARTVYSDPLCKIATSTLGPVYIDYSALCATTSNEQSTLALVNSNGFPLSTLTMASIRSVHITSLSCVITSVSSPCPSLLSSLDLM